MTLIQVSKIWFQKKNDLFYVVEIASVCNFVDDSFLTTFAKIIPQRVRTLESESANTVNWFKENKITVNSDKFQAVINDKRRRDHTNEETLIDQQNLGVVSSEKPFGVQLHDKLNFSLHISDTGKSSANQLNAIIKLKPLPSFKTKKVLINNHFSSNFDYCPLFWMFSISRSMNKIENIQKNNSEILCNEYKLIYEELSKKANKTSVNVNRLRIFCSETYKTLNSLNTNFVSETFQLKETYGPTRKKKLILVNHMYNQVTFGRKSIRSKRLE